MSACERKVTDVSNFHVNNKASKKKDSLSRVSVPDYGAARLVGIAGLVSVFSFFYFFQHQDLLLYGDAVAHINIARRVFDSQTPGLLQLGTVWLPLPHLLMIPFIFPDSLWQNGAGGSLASMIAYVFGVLGIFSLARDLLEADFPNKPGAKPGTSVGAYAAAFIYGANPNLIYMQATAMTESIYLALFIWAVVFFAEFIRCLRNDARDALPQSPDAEKSPAAKNGDHRERRTASTPLVRCALCLAGAELTRYDGWFLAAALGTTVVMIVLWRWKTRTGSSTDFDDGGFLRLALKFVLAITVVPVLWLAYNGLVYGNVLAFANGPYSAKAIEQRVGAPNPALNHTGVAAIYFLKSAQLNMAEGNWGRFWLAAAIMALAIAVWKLRVQSAAMLSLWAPLVFYALSIAYGSVPLHVYTWWPFATFNQRYGLELLPMFAVSIGVLIAWLFRLGVPSRHAGKLTALVFALVIGSYAAVWKAEPQCLAEARRNWAVRSPLNSALERLVSTLPRRSRFLMDLGEHVGVMEQARIPLRYVVNNENHRAWKRPSDPEGLWERALANPERYVDFVIAFDGDLVAQGVNKTNLIELTEIHASGQPHAHIYATQIAPNQPR